MRIKTILTIIGLLIYSLTFGQDYFKYYQYVEEASQLYDSHEYLKSGHKYSEAFMALENKLMMDRGIMYERYNAACSWALAGETDSSFIQLLKIAKDDKFKGYKYILADTDLNSLHQDPRWTEVLEIVKSNEANIDRTLVAILDTIFMTDQEYRLQIDSVGNEYGWGSKELESFTKIIDITIKEIDSINMLKVEEIIDKYGWPGSDMVGEHANQTIWLIIQHSDLVTQERYLPMMREAVKNGKASASDLAYLEDRVALRQGKKQIYGSQIGGDPETNICYVSPLEDPDNVDKRRAEAGLPPLALYVSQYQIKWDVEQYKKDLPSIEAKEKDRLKE